MNHNLNSNKNQLVVVENVLDRRSNHHGMVEYLVKLKDQDKMEWVPWTNLYSPQLREHDPTTNSTTTTATTTTTNSSSDSLMKDNLVNTYVEETNINSSNIFDV